MLWLDMHFILFVRLFASGSDCILCTTFSFEVYNINSHSKWGYSVCVCVVKLCKQAKVRWWWCAVWVRKSRPFALYVPWQTKIGKGNESKSNQRRVCTASCLCGFVCHFSVVGAIVITVFRLKPVADPYFVLTRRSEYGQACLSLLIIMLCAAFSF